MRRAYLIGVAVLVLGGLGIGGGVAVAQVSGDGQVATGPEADAAIAAALEITGGGVANEVELDSEAGATWEVEVTKPDGNTVDVRLDESYGLVLIEDDSDAGEAGDNGEAEDNDSGEAEDNDGPGHDDGDGGNDSEDKD